MRNGYLLIATAAAATALAQPSLVHPSSLDSLGIITSRSPRQYCYTNKNGAFLYGESNRANSPGWEGFTVEGHSYLEDYVIEIDGARLERSSARTTIYPDYLRREYPGGVAEEVHPADSLAAFVVIVTSPRPAEVRITPMLPGGRAPGEFDVRTAESAITTGRKSHAQRTEAENFPVWLTVYGPGFTPAETSPPRGRSFAPGSLAAGRGKTRTIAFAVGDTPEGALALARFAAGSSAHLAHARRTRMEDLLRSSAVSTTDPRFDRALAWAKLSLDALTVSGGGIYAGLPWFADYWGRDTFISLPGDALVSGHFADARRILTLFASFQQRDSLSTDYGRIPNRVTATDTSYNTADGTPRFVMMVKEYAERSGDRRFAFTMYPVILRSIEGTIRYHTDSLGFLTHRDAETWMDAAGPDGAWSPRGNRANDIQALWGAQLETGEYFATLIGDVSSARRWHDALLTLRRNFRRLFVTPAGIADRLRPDGTPDMTLRPNQVFTSRLLDEEECARMVDTVVSRLAYDHGVASLSQEDPGFHPWHEYPPWYPKDAAYHNGTVWTWLQGPLISLLCPRGGEETAWKVTANSVHQILDRGAAGTQSELIDALPRTGEAEPRLSGTFSQAWNLAEFIRNFYDDYLGVRYNRLARSLDIAPHLPRALSRVSARINAGEEGIAVKVSQVHSAERIEVSSAELADSVNVHALVRSGVRTDLVLETTLPPRTLLTITESGGTLRAEADGKPWPSHVSRVTGAGRTLRGLHLASPHLRGNLTALKGPGYPLIPHETIMKRNPGAEGLIDARHAPGGPTRLYSYPRNPAFVPGSFALRHFTVSADSAYAYFTLGFDALSDPGWHPEYGFQLTFAAIAIDEDGTPGSGGGAIGRNALTPLDSTRWYERIIYVGGGVQVEDAHGKILSAYVPVPADAAHPFGNADSGIVRFALPLTLLGRPGPGWTYTVVTGAQDDHGGAGIGEFRTVNGEQGEWNGGGRTNAGDPNTYDMIVAQTHKVNR